MSKSNERFSIYVWSSAFRRLPPAKRGGKPPKGGTPNFSKYLTFSVKLIFAVCTLFALFSNSAFGKTLAEYKSNVIEARNLTLQLLYPDEEITASAAEYENFEKNALEKIRKNIPTSEKIEWENSSIETDNRWLAEKLDVYQKAAADSNEREQILNEISERLDAVAKKIAEIENPPISQRTKDEDKRKLSEILKREEFKKADEQDKSLFQRIYETVMAWLAELFPRPEIKPGQSSGFGQFSSFLVYGFFALILAGIGYLIYKFAPQFVRRYRTREKKEKADRVILGETLSADQNASDLFSEAEKLAREGNLRGAIRKGYIALLCELSDRKIIGLSGNKTNRDYLRDVKRGRGGELYQNMNGLTLNFERHWYGFESADEKDWEEFKNGYKKTVSSKA